ncbi:hypothetical protein [Winogradskyella undariae]|uniref:hypothetical protein n=1 Tax=Winogradskyella undariae TaxID=1285465 RepID=UPI001C5379B6|nr:hypothetical protein [Winogradskyella undariae]
MELEKNTGLHQKVFKTFNLSFKIIQDQKNHESRFIYLKTNILDSPYLKPHKTINSSNLNNYFTQTLSQFKQKQLLKQS